MSAVIKGGLAASSPLAIGIGGRTIAFDGSRQVTLATFQAQVRAVAALLPAGVHAINLCDDRYRFLVAFCAVAVRGQTTLLPPSRAPAVISDELRRHADSYCIGDADLDETPPRYWRMPQVLPELDGDPLLVDDDALVAIGFTSGSTGEPRPNPKTWRSFRASTAQNLAALQDLWPAGATAHLVATVPAQHMYGMEMSVLLPLLGGVAVHAARPFFPEDIAQALRCASAPRLLVTTPVHLRALVESSVQLPPLAGIVSATAPLPATVAAAAEARFGCEVRELFGSTETCVIARRRTARDSAWTPLPGVQLQPQPDGSLVQAPHLPAPVGLADLVELTADGRFHLRGRQADLLEIAGKRASLGDLTRQLQAVPGVRDAVMFQLDTPDAGGVRRIAALVVAPDIDEATILNALRRAIDPVFLPRPLKRVACLPRNDTGKLPRAALLQLLQGDVHSAD
ncbi:AMP-binding protein [Cognatiluteimonas profundi]|uniref:AMP-binding protein n=1 Tax=Cognatiluteimonas profundi TaxID=2594501 RepID=UPI00131C6EE5|nr:AMP-binding protein [Lysobacter profundi]